MQTADIISKKTGVKIQREALLREKTAPLSQHGILLDDPAHKNYIKAIKNNIEDPKWHFEKEENIFDVKIRAISLLEKVKKLKIQNILLVTHGGFIRNLLAVVLLGDSWSPIAARNIFESSAHGNTALTRLRLSGNGNYKLVNWNDEAHLAE